MEDGFLTKNPARLKKIVKLPTGRDIRAEREEMVTWTAPQLKAFLEWNRDTYKDQSHPLWLALASTGMRRGEALALRWSDVDHKAARISIRRAADSAERGQAKSTKSGRARIVDADAALLVAIKVLRATKAEISRELVRPGVNIFGNEAGELRNSKRITDTRTRRITQAHKTLEEDTFPKMPLHGLRHSHATILLALGEHPNIVQERLGHGSIAITMDLYSHVTATMQRTAVDRFAALFGEA